MHTSRPWSYQRHKAFESTWCSMIHGMFSIEATKKPIIERSAFFLSFAVSVYKMHNESETNWWHIENACACTLHRHSHTYPNVHTKFTLCSSISELVADPFQYQTLHLYNKPVTHYVHKHLQRITTNCMNEREEKKWQQQHQARPSCALFFPVSFHRHHMIGKSINAVLIVQ